MNYWSLELKLHQDVILNLFFIIIEELLGYKDVWQILYHAFFYKFHYYHILLSYILFVVLLLLFNLTDNTMFKVLVVTMYSVIAAYR